MYSKMVRTPHPLLCSDDLISQTGSKVLIHTRRGTVVTHNPDGTVTKTSKYGGDKQREFECMQAAWQAGLPCPEPLGFEILDNDHTAIHMSYAPGTSLDKLWETMRLVDKESIFGQLKVILEKMRALEAPPGHVGGCATDGVIHDGRFLDNVSSGGPFVNEAAFNEWLLEGFFSLTPRPVQEAISQRWRKGVKGHRIVFTHTDLSPRNIMVKEGRITGILGWKWAGWLPEYWEYVRMVYSSDEKDWRNNVNSMFPHPYYDELVDYVALRKWLDL